MNILTKQSDNTIPTSPKIKKNKKKYKENNKQTLSPQATRNKAKQNKN